MDIPVQVDKTNPVSLEVEITVKHQTPQKQTRFSVMLDGELYPDELEAIDLLVERAKNGRPISNRRSW